MPLLALSKRTKGAVTFVIFADGRSHEYRLANPRMISAAKADAVRFNTLAAAAR